MRVVDSSADARQKWLDSFKRTQDSSYRASLNALNKKRNVLKEEEKQEASNERKKITVRIVICILAFIALVLFLRRYRSRT